MPENELSHEPKVIEKRVEDCPTVSEGVNLVKVDDEGKLFEEQSVRFDARKTTGCRVDLSGPEPRIIVSGKREARMDNLSDENEAGTAFAEALSRENGRSYVDEPKLKEDSEVTDICLRDTVAGDRVGVQIRNFDEIAIKELGANRGFDREITIGAIADAICAAIADKNRVDARYAARTYLLLISPYPLPPILHPAIRAAVAACNPEKKYLQTWIASRREPTFRVQS